MAPSDGEDASYHISLLAVLASPRQAMVNVECDLHMTSGEGEGSYAKYSRRQVIALRFFSITHTAQIYICTCFPLCSSLRSHVQIM